jgi:hypothetical protein
VAGELPVMLPEKLQKFRMVAEMESVEGGATDLTGDSGGQCEQNEVCTVWNSRLRFLSPEAMSSLIVQPGQWPAQGVMMLG